MWIVVLRLFGIYLVMITIAVAIALVVSWVDQHEFAKYRGIDFSFPEYCKRVVKTLPKELFILCLGGLLVSIVIATFYQFIHN